VLGGLTIYLLVANFL